MTQEIRDLLTKLYDLTIEGQFRRDLNTPEQLFIMMQSLIGEAVEKLDKIGWRTIDTAPKDGNVIALYDSKERLLFSGQWGMFINDEEQSWIDSEWIDSRNPTHWTTLPEATNETSE